MCRDFFLSFCQFIIEKQEKDLEKSMAMTCMVRQQNWVDDHFGDIKICEHVRDLFCLLNLTFLYCISYFVPILSTIGPPYYFLVDVLLREVGWKEKTNFLAFYCSNSQSIKIPYLFIVMMWFNISQSVHLIKRYIYWNMYTHIYI